jgi:hypothetical protein
LTRKNKKCVDKGLMKLRLKQIGLCLALIAAVGLTAHVGHAESAGNGDNCFLCHAPSTGAAPVVVAAGPSFIVVSFLASFSEEAVSPALHRSDSPRAPPAL